MHHFLEICQYTCNTIFLYQNLMGDPQNNLKKCKFPGILAATHVFLRPYINLISEYKNLSKIR